MQIEQALVIPATIVVVQVVKPLIKRDNIGGLLSLVVAFIGTLMVNVYSMSEEIFNQIGTYEAIKIIIECFFAAIVSWLSASKIYDFILGDKKWDKEVATLLEERYAKGIEEGKSISTNKPV